MQLKPQIKGLDVIESVFRESGLPFEVLPSSNTESADFKIYFPENDLSLCLDFHYALVPAQLSAIQERLRKQAKPRSHFGIVVQRLSQSLLAKCREDRIPAIDLEGNAFVRLPGLYIDRFLQSPKMDRKPSSGTIFTAKASRIARAFLARYPYDFWTQAKLAEATGMSRGYVSTLISRMVAQGYMVNRGGGNLLYLEEPDQLLDDWLAHYRFDRHRRLNYALSMNTYEQGLEKVAQQLRGAGIQYAFTGWSGAHLRAPYGIPPVIMAYVERAPFELDAIFPVEKGGNLVLILPHDDGVFQFSNESPYGKVASDPQLYLDLRRMPGRAQEQADALRHRRLNFARRD